MDFEYKRTVIKKIIEKESNPAPKKGANPPGHDVICRHCGHPQNILFYSHKVYVCPACGQNPVGI